MLYREKVNWRRTLRKAYDSRFTRHAHHLADRAIRCGRHFAGGGGAGRGSRCRAISVGIARDKCAASGMCAEKTLGTQFSIGVDGADAADIQLVGEVPAGGQTNPGAQSAALNRGANVADKLPVDWFFTITV